MTERILSTGNDAVARAAIAAGCKHYFGYPITPQSEISHYMARELPKLGGCFLQSEGEYAAAYMLLGGALSGERTMTSTSSPGVALMQEPLSMIITAEIPAVIVDTQRLGPGTGTGGQQGQTDYSFVTRGVYGGIHYPVLAPYSVSEIYEYVQLAFHIADKYRILTMVLTDFVLGRMTEHLDLNTFDFGQLPEKDWALKGKANKGGRCDLLFTVTGLMLDITGFFAQQQEKSDRIIESEIRYDTYQTDDADIIIVAYGYSARASKRAVNLARSEGIKAGLFRPITLWPFPKEALQKEASKAGKVLVVEDSPGEMVEDVKLAVQGATPVHFLGIQARHTFRPEGLIFPERILQEVREIK
jgi:2-oxoglutarate ferredoxin oxidoreductase subunit alpha